MESEPAAPRALATIVPARLEHAFVLATTMRPKDVAEVRACGLGPLEALLQSLRLSSVAHAVLLNDEVGAMFGVCPDQGDTVLGRREGAQLWFLTGHLFGERPRPFLRVIKRTIASLLEQFDALWNIIDANHDDALRTALWVGAELGEPVPVGPFSMPFVPFQIRRQ